MEIQNIHRKQPHRPAISHVIKRQGMLIGRYEVDMRIMNGSGGQALTLRGAVEICSSADRQ